MRNYIGVQFRLLVCVFLLCIHIFCVAVPAASQERSKTTGTPGAGASLRAGASKVNITPPLGVKLIGSYGKPSDSILDELYAKALVLDDGKTTLAIVSVDLLYSPLEEITNPVREIIKEKTGIPYQNVLVCGTHTHSGPEIFTRSKLIPGKQTPLDDIDRAYLKSLINKIAGSVYIAYQDMQDGSGRAGRQVKIGAAKGKLPEIIYNRRPRRPDGSVEMAFTLPKEVTATRKIVTDAEGNVKVTFTMPDDKELEFGPVDPEVCVLRVEDMDGGIMASLVNFGCHPVSIYPHLSTAISADFPAYTAKVVEEMEGGICLFTLGLAGNVVPIQRGVEARKQIGRAIGGEALRRLQFVSTSGDVTLKALKKEVRFPVKKSSSSEQVIEADTTKKYITTEFQVLRLGDIYILGLPGEVLVEVGMEIKRRAGVEKLFVISICNDSIGYVCQKGAYDEGGYESGTGTNLAKGAGEIMVKEALNLIGRIR
jgi:neutral ceramidase